jgi:hypothetical protein
VLTENRYTEHFDFLLKQFNVCDLGCEETESYWSDKGWSYLSIVLEDK